MSGHGNVPKVVLRGGAHQTITLTISANEANMQRLATMLIFAARPGDDEFKAAIKTVREMRLPWEDPADARYVPATKTKEQLQEAATEAIQRICNTWVNGHEDVVKTLASFGVSRLRDLSDDQLPAFIEALKFVPSDDAAPETNNPDDLV